MRSNWNLIDLPDSGLAAKENHLSNILLGTFQTLPKNPFFQFSGKGNLQKNKKAVTLITIRLLMLTHNADASPKLRMTLLG